jgi:hypothetical protein
MTLYTFYILMGIVCGVAAAYGLVAQWAKHVSDRTRHSVALERNTEVTEKLNGNIEKLGDKINEHDKRIDKIEYKLWGFDEPHKSRL